jgi:hypothetical protein
VWGQFSQQSLRVALPNVMALMYQNKCKTSEKTTSHFATQSSLLNLNGSLGHNGEHESRKASLQAKQLLLLFLGNVKPNKTINLV